MSKKGCDSCKPKRDADSLIKNIEDINKSTSVNYVKGNKTLKKYIFNILKLITYIIGFILVGIIILPILIYIIFSKKQIKFKLPNLNKLNQ